MEHQAAAAGIVGGRRYCEWRGICWDEGKGVGPSMAEGSESDRVSE